MSPISAPALEQLGTLINKVPFLSFKIVFKIESINKTSFKTFRVNKTSRLVWVLGHFEDSLTLGNKLYHDDEGMSRYATNLLGD